MIGVEVDYPLGATILKKKFSKMNPGQIAAKKKRNKFGSNIMFIQNCEISLCLSPLLVFFFVPDDTMTGFEPGRAIAPIPHCNWNCPFKKQPRGQFVPFKI